MDFGISGRIALITGGSRGLGRQAALSLAGEGVHVAICSRGKRDLQETADELRSLGVKVAAYEADLSDHDVPGRVIGDVERDLGPLDILVNNVGGSMGTSDVLRSTEEDFARVYELNTHSALRMMKLAVPAMQQRRWGRVINISSIYGREHGGTAPYMVAKAALIAMSKHLAMTVARDGVCVNCIAPGSILFPGGSWDRYVQSQSEDTVSAFIDRNLPIGRFGWPEPIGDAVAFLASERAGLFVGACINIDGGQSHSLI